MTFDNPSIRLYSNKRYPVTIQTRPTQFILIFTIEKKKSFNGIFKIIKLKNQLPTNFDTGLILLRCER